MKHELNEVHSHRIEMAISNHANAVGVMELVLDYARDAKGEARDRATGMAVWLATALGSSWDNLHEAWTEAVAASEANEQRLERVRRTVHDALRKEDQGPPVDDGDDGAGDH